MFKNLKLQYKLIFPIIIIELVIFLVLAWNTEFFLHKGIKTEVMKGAQSTANLLAQLYAGPLFEKDVVFLEEHLGRIFTEEGLSRISIEDSHGNVVTEIFRNQGTKKRIMLYLLDFSSKPNSMYEATSPVIHDGRIIGKITLTVSPENSLLKVATGRRLAVLIAFLTICLSILVSWLLMKAITKPLIKVTKMAEKISSGNLKQNIEIESNDEVGHLAEAFNRMSIKLRDSYANLEEQVIERTKELSDSKMELEALFNGITDMISVQDTDYNILLVNRSTLAEYATSAEGVFKEKIIGTKCYSLHMGKDKPCENCPVEQTIKTNKPAFSEQEAGERVLHVYSYPMSDKEEKIKKIIVFRKDMTRERALQKQVIESTKLASLGELAASVANGIKNPLAGINACSQVLRRNFEKDNIKNELLNMILSDVRRLEEIVSIFLDFAEHSSPEFKNTGINKIVEGAVRLIEEQAKSQIVTIYRDYAADEPELPLDEIQIRQALINILVNALQAMPDGGSLRIRTQNAGNKVSLEIADTGIGVPSEKLGSIFDPFFNTKSQGMGLGLSIARMIVEKHGGSIGVKSSGGNGTVFIIEFPLDRKEMQVEMQIEMKLG